MRHYKLFLITLLSSAFFVASAQTKYLKSIEEAKALSQKTATYFRDNKITEFFKAVEPYWPIPKNEIENVEQRTIENINLIESRFGKSIGVLKIKEEQINNFAIRETYMLKYGNSAIRLIYIYYKNDSGWILNGFKWDDSFSEEFKTVN